MLEKYTLPPLPKYANYPNINAKFQTGTAAINRHDLGFPERAFMYKNISKDGIVLWKEHFSKTQKTWSSTRLLPQLPVYGWATYLTSLSLFLFYKM